MTDQAEIPKLFSITGYSLVGGGCAMVLMLPLGMFVLQPLIPTGNDILLYLAATIGCAFVAWGSILLMTGSLPDAASAVAMPTGIGFWFLSAMRAYAYAASEQLSSVAGPLLLGESILFGVVGGLFVNFACARLLESYGPRPAGIGQRFQQIWTSWRSLPVWVQVWVLAVLVPPNVAAVAFLDTPIGRWTAIAGLFVLVTNGTLLVGQARLSGLMGVPHLVVWIPLVIFVTGRLVAGQATGNELVLGVAVLVVNAISVAFDLNDTRKWVTGQRELAWPDVGSGPTA